MRSRVELFEQIRRNHDREGLSKRALAARYGVHRQAEAAGISAALLSGHSLRAGYATAAAAAGVEERKIANVTRHRSLPVLGGYIRSAPRTTPTRATPAPSPPS